MHKIIIAITAASLLGTGVALRAEDAESVVVPLHDASHSPTIRVHVVNGGIEIRGEDRKDISIDSKTHRREEGHDAEPPRTDGMRRLELPGTNGIDVREENNVVNIKTDGARHGGDLIISVPRHASLQLKCLNGGAIEVENVEGEIEAENLNGAIQLKDVGGSVIASSMNGAIAADLKNVDPTKPMSFSTLNGSIDVTLPASVKANVSLKTDNGEILSDFDVKLDASAKTSQDGGRQPDGSFHVRVDRTLHGTINGGGTEYKFRSYNGQITIRKRK